jgi:hypothetical protein
MRLGEWHNEEIHDLYTIQNIIIRAIKTRRMRWVRYVARTGGMRNAYKMLVEIPERNIPIGRLRRR